MSLQFRRQRGRRATALIGVLALGLVGIGAPAALADQPDVTPATAPVEVSGDPASSDPTSAAATGDADTESPDTEAPDTDDAGTEAGTDAAADLADSDPAATPSTGSNPADIPAVRHLTAQLPAQAPAATGTATGLTLTVLRDGTPNNDGSWDADDAAGNDSSESNGIVRTHDSVVYHWGYSVVTPGDLLLTQTLPEGMSWVVGESVAACAEGADAVSADGRTLSCTRADQSTGAATYQVRAMVDYGANGQLMSTALTSAGAPDSAPAEVTVSARPMVNMSTFIGATGAKSWNGVAGQSVNYQTYLYQQIDPNRGIRERHLPRRRRQLRLRHVDRWGVHRGERGA
jgi:hypothetical protein